MVTPRTLIGMFIGGLIGLGVGDLLGGAVGAAVGGLIGSLSKSRGEDRSAEDDDDRGGKWR